MLGGEYRGDMKPPTAVGSHDGFDTGADGGKQWVVLFTNEHWVLFSPGYCNSCGKFGMNADPPKIL